MSAPTSDTKRSHFELVGDFQRAFGQPTRTKPSAADYEGKRELLNFRHRLLDEEYKELMAAYLAVNHLEELDAYLDLLYVGLGAYHALGLGAPASATGTKSDHTLVLTIRRFHEAAGPDAARAALDDILGNIYEFALRSYKPEVLDAAFREVHRSNMSKLCPDRDSARATVSEYVRTGKLRLGAGAGAGADPRDAFIREIKGEGGGSHFIVQDAHGKALKYVKWSPPNLAPFLSGLSLWLSEKNGRSHDASKREAADAAVGAGR